MKGVSCRVLMMAIAFLLMREGLGTAQTHPSSGSVIADFEGTANLTTLVCNVTNPAINNEQDITVWNIANFRGVSAVTGLLLSTAPELFEFGGDPIPSTPMFDFNNRLAILQLTSELDGVVIYCGIGGNSQQANFMLRTYWPPRLQDNFMVKVLENSQNVTIDLRQDSPAAFPEPTFFNWNKDGQRLTDQLPMTYSNVTFDTVRRADTGNYTVAVTNFILPGSPENNQVGNDTGSFYLDVIYGPFLDLGPSQYYVLLGDPLSLVCGTGLDSNPQAVITWTAPDGTTIKDSPRYHLSNGPEIVRLNFTHTILNDAGMWRCDIRTEPDQYVVSNGSLVPMNFSTIYARIQHDIELTVIAPPDEPHMISVKESEATLFQVCWEAPVQSDSPISYYMIRVCNLNSSADVDKVTAKTITNETFFNVTGLLPGTTYELTVVAVSQGGNIIAESQPSGPIVNTTGVTVPAVTCNASMSPSGVVMVTWFYIHTGGLPLTNVSVSYTFENEFIISRPIAVSITSVDATRITVADLEPGFRYTFNVTAQNRIGFANTLCGLMIPISDQSMIVSTAAIAGGVVGGLVILGFIIGFVILLKILSLRRKGKSVVNGMAEVVYEYPDSLQLQGYKPKCDQSIKLKDCPAYEKWNEQPDIELIDCPAYVEKKEIDQDIKLEECPAYEKPSQPNAIELVDCPAYVEKKRK